MARISVLLAVVASLAQSSHASILGDLLGTTTSAANAAASTTQNLLSFGSSLASGSGIASDIEHVTANPPQVVSNLQNAGSLLGAALTNPSAVLNADTLAQGYEMLQGRDTDLGNGLSWDFATRGMADTMMGVYVNYMTGGLDPSQPLNVFGSLDTGDKAALAQAFGELLTSMDLTCAWQFAVSGTTAYGINSNFRDSQEVLHVQYIPTTESQIVSIRGPFPQARYFSYSTFLVKNSKLEFVDTINDVDIVADTGVNPFTTGPSGAKDGTYEIFVTPKGDQGLKNEIQYNTEDIYNGSGLVIIYRLVMEDTLTVGDGWGNVDPPTMRVKALGFTKVALWANLKACDATNTDKVQNFLDAQLNFKEGVSDVNVNCSVFNMENNFVEYQKAQYFDMPDDRRLFSCGNRQYVYSHSSGSDMIVVVGGKLPASANVRYSSVSMVDLYPPGRTVKTVTDSDLRKFYKTSDAPTYMIAFYPNLNAASRCRINFPVTPFQVLYGYAISSYPAIVYREMFGKGNNPNLLANLHDQCLMTGDCGNPYYWSQQMDDNYPMVAYIECKKDGTWTAAPADVPYFPPPHVPTPAPTPLWEALEKSGQLKFCVPKISVDVVAWEYFDLWVDNTYLGGGASANNPVYGNDLSKGWSPYDVAVDPATGQVVMSQADSNYMPSMVTMAIKVAVNKPSVFFVDYDMCGYTSNTGLGWKCTAKEPVGNWTLSTFDDSSWLPARVIERGEACSRYSLDSTACNGVRAGAHGMWVELCPGMAAPKNGYVYCRNKLPQKCDRSCSASSTAAELACPDKENAVGFVRSMSPALYSVYVNGKKVNSDYTGNKLSVTKPFTIDPSAPNLVLAFNAIDSSRKNTRAAVIAEFEACGTTFVTDPFWKCTSLEQETDDWTRPTFNDSTWSAAKVRFGGNGAPPMGYTAGVSQTAYYLWGQNVTQINGVSNAYCRAVVPNPLFKTPLNFINFQKNEA